MAVNFHISKDGNLVTIRHIKDSFDLQTPESGKFLNVPRYQEDFNTQTYHLTASNPSGDNIKIVGPDGRVIINAVPYTALKTGAGNSAIGVSAGATVTALNGSSYFGGSSVDADISSNTSAHTTNASNITSLQTTLTSEQAKILALQNTVKSLSGDRGIYITDAKDENSSKVKLTNTLARLQAGSKTSIEIEETSPGTLTFEVAAGASGSEVATTVLQMSGNTQGKTQAEFTTGLFSIKSNSTTGAGALSLLEGSANGTHKLTFRAPAALTADTVLTFPDGAGSSGQVLSTDGSGTLSWVNNTGLSAIHAQASDILRLQSNQIGVSTNLSTTIAADRLVFYDHSATKLTALELGTNLSISGTTLNASFADTNTNIANTDLTLDAARILNLSGNDLDIQTGGSSKLLYDVSANQGNGEWLFSARARFTQPVEFHATGGTSQSQIRFREPPMGGASSVILKGPSTNLASDLTFVLPDADGSAGQFLKTDGSGNLSFASGGSGGGMTETPFVSMSGRASFGAADEEERVLIGTSYGWSFYSQTTEMGDWSSSDSINSTTHSLAAYLRGQAALQMPSDEKKVRMKVTYRVQNGNSTDFGFSIWSGAIDHNSTANANITLRGASATQTVGTSSITAYKKEFTTTSTITDDAVFLTIEQRGGGSGLSTTAYVYYNIHLFLVD